MEAKFPWGEFACAWQVNLKPFQGFLTQQNIFFSVWALITTVCTNEENFLKSSLNVHTVTVHTSESGTSLVPLIVTLTMVGKFSMTAAFGTVVLYAPEIYPTNLR